MSEKDFYCTIAKPSIAEFKDRGSRFIGYTFPIESVAEFKLRLEDVKKEHPKASHFCFAYRVGGGGLVFRSGDDGEPSGSAGKPILGQIDSKELQDTLIIVVRYFGGSLLGIPGLINAYKTTASLALQVTPIIQKAVEEKYSLEFNYAQVNEVMGIIKQLGCSVISQEMGLFCQAKIGIPRNKKDEALYRLGNIRDLIVKGQEQPI